VEFSGARLLVFAKAPEPGKVKTRLIPILGTAGAARLHRQLVTHCLARMIAAELCPVQLWCAPNIAHPFFRLCARRFNIPLRTQHGPDLGARMLHALQDALREVQSALLIGTDCPTLGPDDLTEALRRLGQGQDIVLVPALDGGYALIGARRVDTHLFEGIVWGTETVLAETRYRLAQLGWHWMALEPRWDVDRPADLAHLRRLLLPRFAWIEANPCVPEQHRLTNLPNRAAD
jgi:rSAM/selenodomain-associated transferase 1